MILKSITNEMSWIGNTEEFASLCEMWLKNKRIGKSETQVSVRLVRDYVARGILSRPHPKGKEVLFSYEHLVQFLACRYLLEEGYALKRIADDLQTSSLDVILSWIPGEDNDRAMGLIRKFKASEPSIEMSAPSKLSFDADEDFASDALNYEASAPPSSYHERTRRRASYKVDNDPEYFDQYFDAVREFDKDFSKVIKQDLTAIQLKSWLILFIDRLKLKNLTIEEAEEIGEAIKAALINQARLPDRDTFLKKDK